MCTEELVISKFLTVRFYIKKMFHNSVLNIILMSQEFLTVKNVEIDFILITMRYEMRRKKCKKRKYALMKNSIKFTELFLIFYLKYRKALTYHDTTVKRKEVIISLSKIS
jgi:hypothetical protein